jgi:hypothetical protein
VPLLFGEKLVNLFPEYYSDRFWAARDSWHLLHDPLAEDNLLNRVGISFDFKHAVKFL